LVGGWRRLHSGELHNLNAFLHIIRVIKSKRMKWVGYVARMGEMRNAFKILFRKSGGKKLLGRPRHKWEDNIRMDVREIGWEDMD